MAKRSYRRRSSRPDGDNVGCVWGIIRMLYFRRDPKFLLNSHQAIPALDYHRISAVRSPSRDMCNQDIHEIAVKLDRKTINSVKRSVKEFPSEKVVNILTDTACGFHLNTEPGKTDEIGSSFSSNIDADRTTEESNLKTLLSDFLLEVCKSHAHCSHVDCQNMNAVCPALELLVQGKLNELDSTRYHHDNSQATGLEHFDGLTEPKEFMDGLGILVSNKELLFRLLSRPNLHLLENVHQNVEVTESKGSSGVGPTEYSEEASSSNHREGSSSSKSSSKESRSIFFWKKSKKSNRHVSEEAENNPKKISKIVILRPGLATQGSAGPSNQSHLRLEHLQIGKKASSGFSIKEICRILKLVTGQAQRERNAVSYNDHREDTMVFDDKQTEIVAYGDCSDNLHAEEKFNSFSCEEALRQPYEISEEEKQIHMTLAAQIEQSLLVIRPTTERCVLSPSADPCKDQRLDIALEQIEITQSMELDTDCSSADERQSRNLNSESRCIEVEANPVEEFISEGTGEIVTSSGMALLPWRDDENKTNTDEKVKTEDTFMEKLEVRESVDGIAHVSADCNESTYELSQNSDHQIFERNASSESNHSSPEISIEKHDQPSLVFVPDSYLSDNVDSPDFEATARSFPHLSEAKSVEDVPMTPRFSYAEAKLRPWWEGCRIQTVLELPGVCIEENSEVLYLEDERVDPLLYNSIPTSAKQAEEMKLLFDLITEGINAVQWRHFRFFMRQSAQHIPEGKDIAMEVGRYIDQHLSSVQVPTTLEQILTKDLADGSWEDHRLESEHIAIETEDFVIEELIDEAMFELWV